ncbi:hypothetical protein P3X46_029389 [Hevea brasiliensis]|uniref:Amine oxidase domain-containing protein n=1 Tax=Hevea brasiliensis TaxID=3981 RepID=A0ABQ9KTS0_HEVBR|nr:hypothetical protein P3X46_029389 [Hevea brasiliensis]
MDTNITSLHKLLLDGTFASHIERKNSSLPTVIVIGGGISGLAAARILFDASFKVILLESRDRLGGRIHTDYSFGYPVDLGASWLHGVCNENPLAPLIRSLGLTLYRTSGDDSVLYDHDLESYTLFDADGHQVPQQLVKEVGDIFKKILKETERIRDEHTDDMSILQAIGLVLDRHPELRQEGLANEVLQWYICRMEAWFAVDADMISLKTWDQEHVLSGGHGLMVQGYDPIIKALAKDISIHLNHRVRKICYGPNKVMVMVENGRKFIADAAIVTVPIGILKANLIQFEPSCQSGRLLQFQILVLAVKIKLHYNLIKYFGQMWNSWVLWHPLLMLVVIFSIFTRQLAILYLSIWLLVGLHVILRSYRMSLLQIL